MTVDDADLAVVVELDGSIFWSAGTEDTGTEGTGLNEGVGYTCVVEKLGCENDGGWSGSRVTVSFIGGIDGYRERVGDKIALCHEEPFEDGGVQKE